MILKSWSNNVSEEYKALSVGFDMS